MRVEAEAPSAIHGPYRMGLLAGLEPDPILTVSEWSDRYRMLSSRASAEPGRWRTSRTPYLRAVMDALSSLDSTEEVVFMKGAQVGATEAGSNWLGYVIDYAPAPMMLVLPTVDMAKRSSKQRIGPLIEECPRLRDRVKAARERDSGNTMLMKEFPGGVMVMTGANSATGLRSLPARYLFLDEVDAYPGDIDGEGDPVSLARARARTFARRKIFLVSTPTIAGRSRIEQAFERTDKRYYFVPCPHCDHRQVLRWERVRWVERQAHTAHYLCEQCEGRIEEHHKTAMLERGEWRATRKADAPRLMGFHLSALYSPVGWYSWADAAKDWLESEHSQDLRRAFINTVLGECWREKGDAPEWNRLYERRELYPIGRVPAGVAFLTAGADVQRDRIEVEVVGWGEDKQSWSIDYVVIHGDTATEAPWEELDRLLMRTYPGIGQTPNADAAEHSIRVLAVDSGFNTQHVYNWARRYPMSRVMAVDGRASLPMLLGSPSPVDITIGGQRIRRGFKIWPVGVNRAKEELYGWLRLNTPEDGKPYPPGFCHFPQYGTEYFQQLTAEQLIGRTVKGYRHFGWEKTRERNEALDCRVYARCAAAAVGLDRKSPESIRAMAQAGSAPPAPKAQSPHARAQGTDQQASGPSSSIARASARPAKKKRASIW